MSDKLLTARSRGSNAKRILEDPLVIEFFDRIEADIKTGWELTSAGDKDARENAYIMHRLFKNFKEAFKAQIRDGDYAQKQLLKIEETILQKAKRKLNV